MTHKLIEFHCACGARWKQAEHVAPGQAQVLASCPRCAFAAMVRIEVPEQGRGARGEGPPAAVQLPLREVA